MMNIAEEKEEDEADEPPAKKAAVTQQEEEFDILLGHKDECPGELISSIVVLMITLRTNFRDILMSNVPGVLPGVQLSTHVQQFRTSIHVYALKTHVKYLIVFKH